MANSGAGSKFVSVNLNNSYGPSNSSANAGRIRPAHHGGSSGAMVVLSRPRSSSLGSAKSGSRLSVPSPLNLPSLRKEHERFDQNTALGGSAGGRNAGSGPGNASSVAGWSKPATLLEKDGSGDNSTLGRLGNDNQRVASPSDGGARGGGSIYMPPSARLGAAGQHQDVAVARDAVCVEKAIVLRCEDFPTLHASLPCASASTQKQKDVLHQKQKPSAEVLEEQSVTSSDSRSQLHMRPQLRSSLAMVGTSPSGEKGNPGHEREQSQKLDKYLPEPLPLVRLRHTSDWEDDERDTGHGFPNRDRDHGLARNGVIREREFDTIRGMVHDQSDGRGLRDGEHVKVSSRDILRGDPSYGRQVTTTTTRDVEDGSSWRVSGSTSVVKDGFSRREVGINRNGMGTRPFSPRAELAKDSKYSESTYRDSSGNGFRSTVNVSQDSRYAKRDSGYGASGQNGHRVSEPLNSRSTEQNMRSRYGDLPNRYKGDVFQRSSVAKPSLPFGSKGLPLNDPILNFGKEKRLFPNGGKPYTEDAFDTRDPFSGGLTGDAKIFRRKKDVLKQADYHDPAREDFEAELERVQKMQEQERQRIAEEQARALEIARREEEERQRLAREEEERRRRLEEEARVTAWRAEQERLEAAKRAEEQKMAKEEEKRRVILEEERRKEAARQKLFELEARIAKRQAEVSMGEKFATVERVPGVLKGRDGPCAANAVVWEDGERIVERITSSASSDSSSLNRSVETGSRPQSSRDGSSLFLDRGKHSNFWSRDTFESGGSSSFLTQQEHENGYFSRRDGLSAGRGYPRKDFHGVPGVMSYRTSTRGGMPEHPEFDDFPHIRGHRWNFGGDGDHYNRNPDLDPGFPDNSMDKYGDIGWRRGPPHGNANPPYADRLFKNTDIEPLSSFGRSRHSMRQPRVLPPPSLPSVHRTFRDESERLSSSGFLDEEPKYSQNTRNNEHILQAGYDANYHHTIEQSGIMDAAERKIMPNEQKDENLPLRCDSQSSLSVSSPPDSPTHLSHDDLDDSRELTILPISDDSKRVGLSDSEHVVSTSEGITTVVALSLEPAGEDEKWAIENNEDLQQQEEYDEEEDTYHEEDEAHDSDDENLNVSQEFEKLNSKEQNSADSTGRVVLGFDDGVEVEMPHGNVLENASGNVEKASEKKVVSAGITTVGLVGSGQGLQAENGISEGSIWCSSIMVDETGKSLQDLSLHSPVTSATYLLDNVESASCSGLTDHQAVASVMNSSVISQADQPVLPVVSSVLSRSEVPPIKLQFGLFSGPSLIPSPVPAIQIGSIQMPLLHPQVGSSLTQFHPSQPPFFQFGQLRYTPPMSQGILPLAPQTLPFAQPAVSAHYSLNQNPEVSLLKHVGTGSSTQSTHLNERAPSVSMDNKQDLDPKILDSTQDSTCKEQNPLSITGSAEAEVLPSQSQADESLFVENNAISESVSQVEDQDQYDKTTRQNFRFLPGNGDTLGHQYTESTMSQKPANERDIGGLKATGVAPGSKGKRFIYAVRNTGSRSSVPVSEASHADSSGFQRRPRRNARRAEFRLRENVYRRQSDGFIPSNYSRLDEKSNIDGRAPGITLKGGNKRDSLLNKPTKPLVESVLTSGSTASYIVDTGNKMVKSLGKDAPSKRLISARETYRSGEGSLQTNFVSEDVDAPLQSGIVRIFKQPGIEAPSDEGDFIEVRSKRQMLNDRREQREKEIKAKSRVVKAPRKPHSVSRTIAIPANSNKTLSSLSGELLGGVQSECIASDGWTSANDEVSTGFPTGIASPPLPPIGTPAVSTDAITERRLLATKSVSMISVPVSSGGTNLVPGMPFDSKNVALDNVITPFGSWASTCINPQVLTLTQSQLDEAMKPLQFDTHVVPTGDCAGAAVELGKPATSILTQEKSFTSTPCPLNSLLAGEKIQFGAVTSPTILPPSSLPVSSSIGHPGSCRPDISIDQNLSASGAESMSFDKEKCMNPSCVHLEDPEAEAEAAASAIAVAAISSDELVGNELSASSVSVSDVKSFGGVDISGLPSGCGVVSDQKLPSQSRGEESLTVALPADLSVENPPLSLWPPLPSPHNSSGPMLSHFPGAPPPHFPCYEMNPMLGGPIFAFGPHDESAGTQPQSQESGSAATGSLGVWQPCHSGVDSFYGPSTGFTGPFINPGGIPAVQGPPHMFVYNHIAPVGQFGQVGLSFMSTAYIPSGKQPDWKHSPVSSAVGIGEGDIHNLNNSSGPCIPSSLPASIQHLAPGSPLMPMASPLAMFGLSQFQSSAEVPVQARWPHVPTSSLHSVLPSVLPLQQQVEVGLPSQFSHGLSVDASNVRSFQGPHSTTSADSCRVFLPASGSTTQYLSESLIEPSSAPSALIQTSRPTSFTSVNGNNKAESGVKSSSNETASDASKKGIIAKSNSGAGNSNALSTSQKLNSSTHLNAIGNMEQRGVGVPQKIGSGGEWHRRGGFPKRNQTLGSDKNIASLKVKQIYVAKPTTSVPSTTT